MVLLSVSRFFDPDMFRQDENLSMPGLIARETDHEKRAYIQMTFRELEPIWRAGIRSWRIKKIAHNDAKFGARLESLQSIKFADIDRLVEGIVKFADSLNGSTGHEPITINSTSAMLLRLRCGTKAIEEGMLEKFPELQKHPSGDDC